MIEYYPYYMVSLLTTDTVYRRPVLKGARLLTVNLHALTSFFASG